MISINYNLVICTATALFIFIHLLSSRLLLAISHCEGLSLEEKTRIGSTPPSCHNKCNECHPCMAVQVPTIPGGGKRNKSSRRNEHAPTTTTTTELSLDPSPASPGRFSNYKPLGWKCRCGNHLFNP